MAALGERGRTRLQPLHLLATALMAMAVAAPAAADPPTPWPDRILVFMDQARLVQLPERAANVVIGNPLIADVSIQPGGLTVITGKSYGATNFIATDKKGAVLFEKAIEVTGPRERTLVVYNGVERQTYSCTPDCSRRLTLGDTFEFLRQDARRNHLAQRPGDGRGRAVVGTNSVGFALRRHQPAAEAVGNRSRLLSPIPAESRGARPDPRGMRFSRSCSTGSAATSST